MLRHKSPQKRARQDKKKNFRNHSYKSSIATMTKKVLSIIESGDKAKAEEEFRKAQTVIDGAKTKGILGRNTAGRRVGKIARRVAAMK